MDPAALVGAARDAFEAALDRAGRADVSGTLAGRRVMLRTAGGFFADELLHALAFEQDEPMATTPASVDLTLHAWDAASTGVRLPFEWQDVRLGPSGVVENLSRPRYHVSLDVYGALLSLLDEDAGNGYHYLPDPANLPYWERTHPARLLLSAWLRHEGLLVCHAGAVAADGAGVLLVGPSGAGKSTTSLVCLADGMRSAGDDYVVVEPGAPPIAHALYTSTLLERGHADRYRALMPAVDRYADDADSGRSKAIMFAAGSDRPRLDGGFALVAVAALRVERGSTPAFAPIGAGRVLRALAPSTLGQLGMVDAAGLRGLADLCRRLPTFELRLGDDPAPVPGVVRRLLERAQEVTREREAVGT